MVARRLRLTVVASLCGLACAVAVGVAPAVAGATQFGYPSSSEAGHLLGASGLGLDQETGDVYVGEVGDERVSKFDGSGAFQFAWGWGVNQESPAEELQTCTLTTRCEKGRAGSGAGEFASSCGAEGVAVDNDPLSFSYKDVYVVDFCNYRVQKFDSSGKFLLTFGGHVNETTDGNVCVAGEACTKGTEGAGNGEFEWAFEHSYIAVGPDGAVYVGDKARVQVFEPSGVWRENISLAGLSATGKVTALAVDSAGDIYVADEGVAGVRELEPGGIEKTTQFDAGSTTVEAIALDKSGDLFVADGSGGFHVAEYDSSGAQLSSFGSNTADNTHGISFSDVLDELYVSTFTGGIWVLTPPAPGPAIGPGSESATAESGGAANFEATIDPEGNSTTYHVEYVDEKHFQESGYASATSTAPQSIGSGFSEEHVEVHLPAKTLVPGTTYHWRVVAVDSLHRTSTGVDQTLEETPAALIEGPWASNVAGTSATLSAKIDPLGANTSYRLEYGTGASYEHVFSGSVGEGTGYVTVSYHVQELAGGTVYHYRLVTASEVGDIETSDHTFTTQHVGGNELTLPDGRAWELVSPPGKKGALIGPSSLNYWLTQAASDGSGITYTTNEVLGEGAVGHLFSAQVLSTRANGVWRTQYVSTHDQLPPEGESAKSLSESSEYWHIFSSDLSLGLLEPGAGPLAPQSAEATEQTLYLRNSASGSFRALQSEANVPAALRRSGDFYGNGVVGEYEGPFYYAATPDLSYVVFGTSRALTPESESGEVRVQHLENYADEEMNLYEWHDGRLELVNILPDGKTGVGARVGAGEVGANAGNMLARAISSDGRWVVWHYGQLDAGAKVELYARDTVAKRTLKIGGADARFETMSSDGSKIFYTETEAGHNGGLNGDLYVFDTSTGTQTDLTANHSVGGNAGVQNGVLGASQDGSSIYVVATGVLASGAVSGADNLYLLHEGAGGWTTTFITALSQEDKHSWGGDDSDSRTKEYPWMVDSEVSPDGRYVAFMSNSPLTGYDNRDAVSGQRDEEVYLYDASSNHLVCASCDPTGARPMGVFDNGGEFDNGDGSLLVDTTNSWSAHNSGSDHWLAGSLVGWNNELEIASYQPRYVMDSGRLFFNSPDALVPQDTNGLEDVYQYEPAGTGSCSSASVSFSVVSGGCVGLISSGTSASESAFMDASETGDDVFFVTSNKLTFEDYDNAYDMYDAHVCTEAAPCRAEPVSPPECTSGDSCKPAPSPQPTIFGATPSATFKGVGNFTSSPSGSVVTPRALTRAQKLAVALKACHTKKARKKRMVCERQARKRFGAKQARKAKATKKGNG